MSLSRRSFRPGRHLEHLCISGILGRPEISPTSSGSPKPAFDGSRFFRKIGERRRIPKKPDRLFRDLGTSFRVRKTGMRELHSLPFGSRIRNRFQKNGISADSPKEKPAGSCRKSFRDRRIFSTRSFRIREGVQLRRSPELPHRKARCSLKKRDRAGKEEFCKKTKPPLSLTHR